MSHSRNHLVPAFVIKRFKPEKSTVDLFFFDSNIKYDGKKVPVIMIDKKKLLDEAFFEKDDYIYTQTKSNNFVKNEIYFINENFLENVLNACNNENAKEFAGTLKKESLEISYNNNEGSMSLLLDKNINNNNFKNLNNVEFEIIIKFIDSSYLRPLKYQEIENFLLLKENTNKSMRNVLIYRMSLLETESIFNCESFNEMNLVFQFSLIYFKKLFPNENEEILNNLMLNTAKLARNMKNSDTSSENNDALIFLESKNCNFLLGDNFSYNISDSKYSNNTKPINDWLIKNNVINNFLTDISITVVSPNNIIIKSKEKNKIVKNHISSDVEFTKKINALTLFISDEWIVTKNVFESKKDIINEEYYSSLKIIDFFSEKIINVLIRYNFELGIKNKFDNFDEMILNDFIFSFEEECNNIYNFCDKGLFQNEKILFEIIENNPLYKMQLLIADPYNKIINHLKSKDQEIIIYFYTRIFDVIKKVLFEAPEIDIFIGRATGEGVFEYCLIHDLNLDYEYNLVVLMFKKN